jgi:hypothetical protein
MMLSLKLARSMFWRRLEICPDELESFVDGAIVFG